MDYHSELIDKYLHKNEELKYSCGVTGYKDNLTRITITYLGVVLIIAGVVAWFYPEKTFTAALGVGLLGMLLVFAWAFFAIKKQEKNKAEYENIVYAITDSRILILNKALSRVVKEYHFATITHAFVESCKSNNGTVFFQPNANTPYVSSKISGLILYTVPEIESSRLLFISSPETVCDIINTCVDEYEKKMKEKSKKGR